MSAPTICQACGGNIINPAPDKHVCDDCRIGMYLYVRAFTPRTNRTEPSDMTPKLWRFRKLAPEDQFSTVVLWIIAGFVGSTALIMIYWLGKQAGLWG